MLKDIVNLLKNRNAKQQRKSAAKNTAVGLGLGALLGTAAGFLFAPKKGKETREDIAEGAKKAADVVKHKATESYDSAKSALKDMKLCCKKNDKTQESVEEKVTETTNDK